MPIFITRERSKEEVFGISKKPHTLFLIDNQETLAKFHNNPSNLYTLLTCLKQGNPRKNKARVLDSLSFESLSHLIKAAVNWVMQPTNETRAMDPAPTNRAHNQNSTLYLQENNEKSFWKNRKKKKKTGKTEKISEREEKLWWPAKNQTSSQPNAIQKNLVTTMNSLG